MFQNLKLCTIQYSIFHIIERIYNTKEQKNDDGGGVHLWLIKIYTHLIIKDKIYRKRGREGERGGKRERKRGPRVGERGKKGEKGGGGGAEGGRKRKERKGKMEGANINADTSMRFR